MKLIIKSGLLIIICLFGLSCNTGSPGDQKSAAKTAFDADGYYFPADTIKYLDYRIESILIATKDEINSSGDKLISSVQIGLVDDKTGKTQELTTKEYELRNKIFHAVFKTNFMGDIELNSSFTGAFGPINDNVKEQETIVMKGKFEINKDYIRETGFKYFAGD
jgi:hypothetical protein